MQRVFFVVLHKGGHGEYLNLFCCEPLWPEFNFAKLPEIEAILGGGNDMGILGKNL